MTKSAVYNSSIENIIYQIIKFKKLSSLKNGIDTVSMCHLTYLFDNLLFVDKRPMFLTLEETSIWLSSLTSSGRWFHNKCVVWGF